MNCLTAPSRPIMESRHLGGSLGHRAFARCGSASHLEEMVHLFLYRSKKWITGLSSPE